MKRLFAVMTAALLMTALVASTASAAPGGGNSSNARCQNNKWQTLVGTTGAFATPASCSAYVAGGGVLYPKIATLTSVTSGPVAGLGALTGSTAMLFTIGGSLWVPNQAISLTYTAGAPLSYTVPNPTLYFPTAPAAISSGTGSLSTWFQDNCFDNNGFLVSGLVPYTITGTDTVGQSASVSGNLDCSAITGPAGLIASSGPLVSGHTDFVLLTASGWRFTPNAPITLTYNVLGVLDGGPTPLAGLFTEPIADGAGSFVWDSASTQLIGYYGDNCVYNTGSGATLQTTDLTFTMTASDGTHTATATGVLQCSLLAS